MQPDVTCHFCGTTDLLLTAAIDAGWAPGFWRGNSWVRSPVCPDCVAENLAVDAHGALVEVEKGKVSS